MTQEKDKQEKPVEQSSSKELADADLDKISGGAEPVMRKISGPLPAEPINSGK